MPTKRNNGGICSVVGCTKRRGTNLLSEVRMFAFPRNAARRAAWALALRRQNWTPTNNSLICNSHFVTGKPADLLDETHPDWAPSINLGYTLKRKPFHMAVMEDYKPHTNFKKWLEKAANQEIGNPENDGAQNTIKPQVIKISHESIIKEIENDRVTEVLENDEVIEIPKNRQIIDVHKNRLQEVTVTNFQIIPTLAAVEETCVKVDTQIINPEDIERVGSEDTQWVRLEDNQTLRLENTKRLKTEDIKMMESENLKMVEPEDTAIVRGKISTNLSQSSGIHLSPECLPKNMKTALNEVCQTLEEIYTTYHDLQDADEDIDSAFCNLIKMLLQNVPHKNRRNIQKKILTVVKNAVDTV